MHLICRLPQKPLAQISALASSPQLVDAGTRASPLSGCKGGSTATSVLYLLITD